MAQDTSQAVPATNWTYRWLGGKWRCGRCNKPVHHSDTTDVNDVCKCDMSSLPIQQPGYTQGWVCPVCHNVYVYWVAQCWECKERTARERVASTDKPTQVHADWDETRLLREENTGLRESKVVMEKMIYRMELLVKQAIQIIGCDFPADVISLEAHSHRMWLLNARAAVDTEEDTEDVVGHDHPWPPNEIPASNVWPTVISTPGRI